MAHTYQVVESEDPPNIITIGPGEGILLNTRFTTDFRIRKVVALMLMEARDNLPDGYRLVLYEAFRPRARQWELWRWMEKTMRERHPGASDDEIYHLTREFIADPRGFGSGHQAGGAVDVTLADGDGRELDMGTEVDEMNDKTHMHSPHLSPMQRRNREVLWDAMTHAGLVNYPSEWWHYCYGDRLWAEMTGAEIAFFAPIAEDD